MIHLKNWHNGKLYSFNRYIGCLVSKDTTKAAFSDVSIPNIKKIQSIIKLINNPYLINSSINYNSGTLSPNGWLTLYAKCLLFFYKYFPPILFLFEKLRLKIFENSEVAINYFCKIHPLDQDKLCLVRSIFAATTSKRFSGNGALFIGVFHPTKHMHAWIIEDSYNPYKYDGVWINYTPVAIVI